MKGFLLTFLMLGVAAFASAQPQGKNFQERFSLSGSRQTEGLFYNHAEVKAKAFSPEKVNPLAADRNLVIKGSLMYSAKWPGNTNRWGIYAMPATGGDPVALTGEEYFNTLDYLANGGATVMDNGHYYICTYAWTNDNFGNENITAVQGTVFNSSSWQNERYKRFTTRDSKPDLAFLSTCMAYDKSTGKIYGCFYGYDEERYSFAILDPVEFKLQTITLTDDAWNACDFDADGNLYAMLDNGDFVTVNKRTGETTLIKKTGIATPYQTSGAINPADSKFYYIDVANEGSVLYSIDLKTGVATEVYKFGYGIQFLGMYFSDPAPALLAPGEPTDLEIDFNGNMETTLSFRMPLFSLSIAPLQGEFTYIVNMDYKEYARGTGTPGQLISIPVKAESVANHYFEVVCENAEGRGAAASISAYAGKKPGLPLAARNFKVEEDQTHWGRLIMNWESPEIDSEGNPVNPDEVAYWIVDNSIYSWCQDFHGNSLVIDVGDLSKKQKFDDYMIISGIELDGRYTYNWSRDGYTTTRARSFGRPYDLPWKERVTYNGLDWNWVMISSPNYGHWRYWDGLETENIKITPYGNDGGMILADADKDNVALEIRGGKVNLGDADNPVLTFYLYRHQSFENDYLLAYVLEAGEQSSTFYGQYSTHAASPEEEGWTLCELPLKDFKGKEIQISFVAVCSKTGSIVTFDEIEIRNICDTDMGITEFSTPATLVPGRAVDFGVTVRNWGRTDIATCTVNLMRDNMVAASRDITDIKAGETRSLTFDELPTPLFGSSMEYYAEIILDTDQDLANNRSEKVSINVSHNEFPAPESLSATVEGDHIMLAWDEPTASSDLALNGYNIYHNGKLLNSEPHPETEFTHENAAITGGEYHVTAVYDQGESKACAPASVKGSGVGITAADTLSIYSLNGTIFVSGATDAVVVFSTDGRIVAAEDAAPVNAFSVQAGVYIVRAGNRSSKVIVK